MEEYSIKEKNKMSEEVLEPNGFNSTKTSIEGNINAKHFQVNFIDVKVRKCCSDKK